MRCELGLVDEVAQPVKLRIELCRVVCGHLDVALRNLAKGAQQGTHKSKRTLTSCITNELTKAAAGDVTSFAVGKKEEVERIAASAR